VSSHSSFLECFRKSGMGVASARDIFRGSSVLKSQYSFGDHLSSVGSDNPDSKDLISLGVTDNLDQTFSTVVGSGSRVGREGELTDVVFDSHFFQFFFRLTNVSYLGVGVDDSRNGIVVDVASLSEDVLNGSDSFLLSLMGEHSTSSSVSDAVNAGYGSLPVVVHFNLASLVGRETSLIELESASESMSSDRY